MQGQRARFIPADANLIANYVAKRTAKPLHGVLGNSLETMREVVFSACLSSEVALESDGHGEFTRRAMQVLAQDVSGLSNGEFAERVTQAFGQSPQQHAKLYCSDAGRALGLLKPFDAPPRSIPAARRWPSARERAELAAQMMQAETPPNRSLTA
jgi:hypothetical protein